MYGGVGRLSGGKSALHLSTDRQYGGWRYAGRVLLIRHLVYWCFLFLFIFCLIVCIVFCKLSSNLIHVWRYPTQKFEIRHSPFISIFGDLLYKTSNCYARDRFASPSNCAQRCIKVAAIFQSCFRHTEHYRAKLWMRRQIG